MNFAQSDKVVCIGHPSKQEILRHILLPISFPAIGSIFCVDRTELIQFKGNGVERRLFIVGHHCICEDKSDHNFGKDIGFDQRYFRQIKPALNQTKS